MSLDITVPDDSRVSVQSHNGRIQVANIKGDLSGESHNGAIEIINTDTNPKECTMKTHNGPIRCQGVNGRSHLETYNGRIQVRDMSGDMELLTHNEGITAEEISGNITAQSYNGEVQVAYRPEAGKACQVRLISHNGGIDFVAPTDFSATVEVRTHNGSIDTELPITIRGKIDKEVKGVIGSGEGRLWVETYNGNIKLRPKR